MIMKNRFAFSNVIRLGVVVLMATLTSSCDDLLSVDTPSFVNADDLNNPARAELIVTGAASDFEFAFQGYVLAGAILGNELGDGTQTAARWEVDQRKIRSSSTIYVSGSDFGIYAPLSTARFTADDALKKLDSWTDAQVPNRNQLIARAAAYAGYSYLLMGEAFCTVAFDLGPEKTKQDAFNLAVERFNRAIQLSANGPNDVLNMARIGLGRALLNLGRKSEAAAAVASVPENFVFNVTASDDGNRRQNRIFQQFNARNVTVDPGYRNLTIDGVADPRVRTTDAGLNTANVRVFTSPKYAGFTTSIPLARTAEAKLIRAEALGGQTAVTLINQLRAVHGLPAFASTSEQQIQAQVIVERLREFFLESHTLYDLTRYNLPLSPEPGSRYRDQNETYGNQRCFPLPDVERDNNPNI
jgi:hypothetical protein